MSSNSTEILPVVTNSVEAIKWLIKEGILIKELNCPECGQKMELRESSKTEDPISWQCLNQQQCSTSQRSYEISCRIDSYFEGEAPINLEKCINIIKGWCYEAEEEMVMTDVGLTVDNVSMIYQRCRRYCSEILQKVSIKLQSKEICAAVKELTWTHESSGTSIETHLLVLVDAFAHSEGYMEILAPEKRDAVSLLSIIASVVQPGSRVYIDSDINYLNSISTHNLELFEFYPFAKWKLNSYINSHKEVIEKIQEPGLIDPQDYLYEAMWRERFRVQRCKNFINQLNNLYRPE